MMEFDHQTHEQGDHDLIEKGEKRKREVLERWWFF